MRHTPRFRPIRLLLACLAFTWVVAACATAATPTPVPPAPESTATPAPPLPESVDAEGHHVLGDPNAPVTILDYSDFQ